MSAGTRKYSRNESFCKQYRAECREDRNRRRRVAKNARMVLGDAGRKSKAARLAKSPRGGTRHARRAPLRMAAA